MKWRHGQFQKDKISNVFKKNINLLSKILNVKNLQEIFLYFFIELLDLETNRYSFQQFERTLGLTRDYLKKYIRIYIMSSIVELPSMRCHWCPTTIATKLIRDAVSVNTFEKIKQCLHFNNNENMKQNNEVKYDRLFKIRPLVNSLLNSYATVPKEECLSLDEQLFATKTHSYIRKYIPTQ